jgi:hypothetical protein
MNYNFIFFVAAQNASTSRINMEGLPSGWTLQVGVALHQSFTLEQLSEPLPLEEQTHRLFTLELPSQSFTLE